MLHVAEHQSIAEIATLRADWLRLLAETPDADYFQSPDWLEIYWRHYGTDQQLRILQIFEGNQTVGIVPLVVRRESTKIGLVRVLTYPLDDWGTFYGPIGLNRQALLSAAMNHMRRCEQDWDVVDLRWVNTSGGTHDWLLAAMEAAKMNVYRRPRTVIPVARLDADWESYWSGRSSGTRSNLRRYERKVEKLGQVEHIRFRPQPNRDENVDPCWDLYDACESLAAMSWQGSSTTGTTLSHKDVRAHLRDQHERAVQAGGIDINLLRIDGRNVAFQYNYYFAGRVSNLRLGFDPEFTKVGVGKVLMMKVLRDSCERGDTMFDFLPRHVEAKRRFATDILDGHSFFYCPAKIGRTLPLLGKRIYDDWQTSKLVGLPIGGPATSVPALS